MNSSYDEDENTVCTFENVESGLPKTSKDKYVQEYKKFLQWKKDNQVTSFSETVFLTYFDELSKSKKPSTLWSYYSMLKSTVQAQNNIDISKYDKLGAFLKRQNEGFQSEKGEIFSLEQINEFLSKAPDRQYLLVKVSVIFGVAGAMKPDEQAKATMEDIIEKGDWLVVDIPATKTRHPRRFAIDEKWSRIVKQYRDLRPAKTKTDRFFLQYLKGKCTIQVVGINSFYKMPRRVAEFLKLPNPHLYSGHSLRRTSASKLIKAVADMDPLKRHGSWHSSKLAEGYVEQNTPKLITSSIASSSSGDNKRSVFASTTSDDRVPAISSSNYKDEFVEFVFATTGSNDDLNQFLPEDEIRESSPSLQKQNSPAQDIIMIDGTTNEEERLTSICSSPPIDEVRNKLSSYLGGQITCTKNEENGFATICINHPERKNAISGKMMVDFENIINDLQTWNRGKAVLIHGAGDMFCSGSDLNYLRKENTPESGYQMATFMNRLLYEFSSLPLVSVAYITGAGTIGGGAEFTLACDYRLFSSDPKTRIGFIHNKMGIVPAWDGATKLVQIVGKCKALDLLLTGRLLDYHEANKIGLVNDTVENLESAEAWLLEKVKYDVSVVRATKAVIVNAVSTCPEIKSNYEQKIFASLWNAPANKLALEAKIKHLK